jgi:hypothetical protein
MLSDALALFGGMQDAASQGLVQDAQSALVKKPRIPRTGRPRSFGYHDPNSTLWGWANQNPARFVDPSGRSPYPPPEDGDWDNPDLTCQELCAVKAALLYAGCRLAGDYYSCIGPALGYYLWCVQDQCGPPKDPTKPNSCPANK